jgi:hypothetical protein
MWGLAVYAIVAAAAVRREAAFGPSKTKPHVLFILVDDLGHAELGFNRIVKTQEVSASELEYSPVSGSCTPFEHAKISDNLDSVHARGFVAIALR